MDGLLCELPIPFWEIPFEMKFIVKIQNNLYGYDVMTDTGGTRWQDLHWERFLK